MQLFRRRFKLTVQVAENKALSWSSDDMGNTGLKVDFSVQKTVGGIGEQADITVTGLSLEHIGYLCTVMRPRDNDIPKNFVQLEAGYGDDYGVIFQGGIFEIVPNVDVPDMAVKLTCTAGFQDNKNSIFQFNGANVPYLDIVKALAEHLKMPLKVNSTEATTITVKSVSIDCSGLQAISAIRELRKGLIDIYLSGGVLYVDDTKAGATGNIIKLTGESGLIGTPQPTVAGVNCKSLLRPSLQAGNFFYVESKKLPIVNGTYRIMNVTHTGSTRGNEFYSVIEANRF